MQDRTETSTTSYRGRGGGGYRGRGGVRPPYYRHPYQHAANGDDGIHDQMLRDLEKEVTFLRASSDRIERCIHSLTSAFRRGGSEDQDREWKTPSGQTHNSRPAFHSSYQHTAAPPPPQRYSNVQVTDRPSVATSAAPSVSGRFHTSGTTRSTYDRKRRSRSRSRSASRERRNSRSRSRSTSRSPTDPKRHKVKRVSHHSHSGQDRDRSVSRSPRATSRDECYSPTRPDIDSDTIHHEADAAPEEE